MASAKAVTNDAAIAVPTVVERKGSIRASGRDADGEAVAGAGFGMLESQWALNAIFASGWTWEAVTTSGVVALAGFWERFFTTALHAALSGMAGYSLARGWGWQGYLVMSFLHALANYTVLLVQSGAISVITAEIYIALFALMLTAVALWWRWRKTGGEAPVAPPPES